MRFECGAFESFLRSCLNYAKACALLRASNAFHDSNISHHGAEDLETLPGSTVPAAQQNVDFTVKDSKRFADSGGWGWGAFEYDAKSDTFTPATTTAKPPQGNDAKCGLACHTTVKNRDYVFTSYGHR